MPTTKHAASFKKFLPLIIILAVIILVIILIPRKPKGLRISEQEKQDFLNYVKESNLKAPTKQEKTDFLKAAKAQPEMTQQQKDDFLKAVR